MARKVRVVNYNDDTSYNDISEAVCEKEIIENTPVEEVNTEEAREPEPPPKPKARAKIITKPKAIAWADAVVDVDTEIENEISTPEIVETKAKPKRAAKVKIVEPPSVVEQLPEKPKAVRKPRVTKEEPLIVEPAKPVRLSRADKREQLYHSLASNALP